LHESEIPTVIRGAINEHVEKLIDVLLNDALPRLCSIGALTSAARINGGAVLQAIGEEWRGDAIERLRVTTLTLFGDYRLGSMRFTYALFFAWSIMS
jgi:hypothetical protein